MVGVMGLAGMLPKVARHGRQDPMRLKKYIRYPVLRFKVCPGQSVFQLTIPLQSNSDPSDSRRMVYASTIIDFGGGRP